MKQKYRKILEIGPIAPPWVGWAVRIDYLLKTMRRQGMEAAALDLGLNRKVRRPQCDRAQSGLAYGWKVFCYLCRGYRVHNHIHAESPKAYVLVLYASFLSWLFRRPSVLTFHGGVPQKWFPHCENRLVDFVQKLIFRLNRVVVCNDQQIKDLLVAYGVAEDKVAPIPSFSRQYLEYEPQKLPTDVEQFLDSRAPRMVSYCNFRPEFFVPVLIGGLARLRESEPDFGLVIAGDPTGSEQVLEQLAAAGVADNVLLAGNLGRDQFLTLLSRADICVRTPLRDGISSSVLEALALGIPVVCAANDLRPAEAVTYPYDDPQALADAINYLLTLPENRRRPPPIEIEDTVRQEIEVLVADRMPAVSDSEIDTESPANETFTAVAN